MTNYVQEGDKLRYTAGANITSGQAVLVGKRLGVASTAIANGDTGVLCMEGVYTIAKLSTDVVAQGSLLYWDDTNKRLTVTSTDNTLAGYAFTAAGNGATTVNISINR